MHELQRLGASGCFIDVAHTDYNVVNSSALCGFSADIQR